MYERWPSGDVSVGPSLVSNGFDALRATKQDVQIPASFTPNSAYEQYLKMHKVFVGKRGAEHLESLHQSMKEESMPRYLCAAGWAAAEAAIVQKDLPTMQRLSLLESGAECWERAIMVQRVFNAEYPDKDHLVEHSAPLRIATDLAVVPLLRGLILGDITKQTCQEVFADCLAIAQANLVQLDLARREGDTDAVSDHAGFAHECNAILSLNRKYSESWFAIPTMARSDTGYYHPEQTHDILVIRRKGGDIQNIVPVEVKASAGLKTRQHYLALLVRGKMHLCIEGQGNHLPRTTLDAITAVHDGSATPIQTTIADAVSRRFMDMLNDYFAGQKLGHVAAGGVLTTFRDKSLVANRHPGLAISA